MQINAFLESDIFSMSMFHVFESHFFLSHERKIFQSRQIQLSPNQFLKLNSLFFN